MATPQSPERGPATTTKGPTVPHPDSTDIPAGRETPAPGPLRTFWRRWRRWIFASIALGIVVALAVPIVRVWVAWSRIERVEFDPAAARELVVEQPPTSEVSTTVAAGEGPEPSTTTTTTLAVEPPSEVPFDGTVSDDDHTAVLVIGTDEGGYRADVIMLALIPTNGSDLALISLPRDLYLENPCGGGRARINSALLGCGDVGGPSLLAVVVEDFTGVPVDHFVLFDFDGFARVIDAVGGVDVCVNHYTYDTKTDPHLELQPGCSRVNGAMALSWVRSRHTRQVVDGVAQYVPRVNDLTRNARQREIVLQLMEGLSDFPNPAELVGLAEALAGAFTLDDGLSLGAAVGIAWDLRGTPASAVDTPTIPVTDYVTETGAQVLLPTESFADTMGWAVD
jgi:LCP family protein required for cell wall assembly